jgi:hypothetical protein
MEITLRDTKLRKSRLNFFRLLLSIQDVQPKKLLHATVPLSTLYENDNIKDKLEWATKKGSQS